MFLQHSCRSRNRKIQKTKTARHQPPFWFAQRPFHFAFCNINLQNILFIQNSFLPILKILLKTRTLPRPQFRRNGTKSLSANESHSRSLQSHSRGRSSLRLHGGCYYCGILFRLWRRNERDFGACKFAVYHLTHVRLTRNRDYKECGECERPFPDSSCDCVCFKIAGTLFCGSVFACGQYGWLGLSVLWVCESCW